jgi:hypothetical protein
LKNLIQGTTDIWPMLVEAYTYGVSYSIGTEGWVQEKLHTGICPSTLATLELATVPTPRALTLTEYVPVTVPTLNFPYNLVSVYERFTSILNTIFTLGFLWYGNLQINTGTYIKTS